MSHSSALDAAAGAVSELVGVDWSQVPAGELPKVAVVLERMAAQLDAVRLAVAGEVEATDAAAAHGWASAKDFLTAVAGGHKGAGGGMLRLQRRLRSLEATRTALAAGELSVAKARVIANRVSQLPRDEKVRAEAERLLLARAAELDATDLDHAWPAVVAELDPDGELTARDLSLDRRERAAHNARFLAFTPDQLGGVKIRGYASLEEVELVKAALFGLSAPQTTTPGACGGAPREVDRAGSLATPCPDPVCAHDGRDPREFGVRLWDALVEGCRRLQTARVLPQSHGAGPRLLITLNLEDLRGQLTNQPTDRLDLRGRLGGHLAGGEPLSAGAVRRLACDAELIPVVLGSASEVLDVGRANRLVTPGIWRALVARDRHCAHPGCRRPPDACDAHHIVHWADGGPTSLDNLVLLCRTHHTLTHHTAWTVSIDPTTRRPVWTPPPAIDDTDRCTRFFPPNAA
ncbi:HNH endonuclease signature motif containing protein [Nocardioides ferulae]|uniref:HNH endonuclease signature motif containing protein n=1 Tax=Nocardioides ferulae TaxID=2340821 RepID=UPI000EADAD12|nr:HNH endonuclease signature motif containing protein [Nocardioides ferulae]